MIAKDQDEEDIPIDGRDMVKDLNILLSGDNKKTFFPDELDKVYRARFDLYNRNRDGLMSYKELFEFLTSINIVMSENVVYTLFMTLSDAHEEGGISYEDA